MKKKPGRLMAIDKKTRIQASRRAREFLIARKNETLKRTNIGTISLKKRGPTQ